MKKMFFVSLLLTTVLAAQAQLKIAPKMQKGDVKNYTTVATNSIPMQGDAKITSESKYTVVDATADGYVLDVETVNVQVEADAENITAKLIGASEEIQKGVVIRVTTDKDGKPTKVLNAAELKTKIEQGADAVIDKMFAEIPQLSQMATKDVLKNQLLGAFTEETILAGLQESTSALSLNGKTIVTGAQEEYISKDGLKMKRMYFVNGKSIVTNGSANITKDELKAMIIEQVEKTMPAQAEIVKQNIDQLLSSGMLKVDIKETSTYEMGDDSWVKSVKTESNSEFVGTKTVVKSETVCK